MADETTPQGELTQEQLDTVKELLESLPTRFIEGYITDSTVKRARNGSHYLKVTVQDAEMGGDTTLYHWALPEHGFLLRANTRPVRLHVQILAEQRGKYLHLVNVRRHDGPWAAPLL